MSKEFRIAHAQIELQGLGRFLDDDGFADALAQSWVPGTEVTRHNRKWKLSGRTEVEPLLWAGHIGFVREGDLTTWDWDDDTNEFIRREASSGVVVPFIINLEHRIVSFQLVSGEVRPNTVTTNLRALLNVERTYAWAVRPVSFRRTFVEWRASVSRVASLRVSLEYPNPSWTGREKVEDLVDGLGANAVHLKARAEEGETIHTDADWFTQLMDHVRRGYGRSVMVGSDKETGVESQYVETAEGGTVPATNRISADEGAAEATVEELSATQTQLVESHRTEIVTVDEDEDSEDDESI